MNLLTSYLKSINFNLEPRVSLEAFSELHRLHTLKFPFENITPYIHQEVVLNVEAIHKKFISDQRGGYCFEQNLLFSTMLKEIGFDVKEIAARVLWNQPEDLITRKSHMLLLVTINDQVYLADVGFGGMTLTTPIKFELNLEQQTTHENFRIANLEHEYKLQGKLANEWKTLYRFNLEEQYAIDYEVANYYLYTNPTSHFRNMLIAAMPVTNGRLALNNNQFTYYPLNGTPEKKILTDLSQVKDVLTDIFKIQLPESELLDTKIKAFLSL